MYMKKLLPLFGCALTLTASAAFKSPSGKEFKSIVIAPDATAAVKYAAKDFADLMKRTCNADLKIFNDGKGLANAAQVYIGDSDAVKKFNISVKDFGSDDSRIFAKDDSLVIIGKDYKGPVLVGFRDPWVKSIVYNPKTGLEIFGENGSMNGVYYFLQKFCGVRFYMPGEIGLVIQPVKDIEVKPLDLTIKPDFTYRFPRFFEFGNNLDAALWAKHLRLGGAYPVQINHSFKYFLRNTPPHKDTFFALVDGVRDTKGGKCCVGHGHFCLTNPEVIQAWIDFVCEYFRKNPHQYIFPVFPGDSLNRVCECPTCKVEIDHEANPHTGIFSNHIFKFVNAVAEGVCKKYPDKFIGFPAYKKHNDPPKFKMHPNTVLVICKRRNSYLNKAYKDDVYKRIDAWRKVVGNRIYFWEYYLDADLPWINLPVQFPHIIADDLRHLNKLGLKGEFIECHKRKGSMRTVGMQHLNLYITSQLYWDCHADVDEMLNEYYRLFYGPAEKEMAEFWTTAEKQRNEVGSKYLFAALGTIRNTLAPSDVFPAPVLNRMLSLLEEAVKKTPAKSVYRKRVMIIKNEFDKGAESLRVLMRTAMPEMKIKMADSKEKRYAAKPQEFTGKDGLPASVKSWIYTGYDKENMYIKIIAYEPNMKKLELKSGKNKKKTAWSDDGIEFFICTDPATVKNTYQFYVSPSGAIWDAKRKPEISNNTYDTSYETHAKVKGTVEANRWIVDIAIPFKSLGIDDAGKLKGKYFTANFYRYRNQKTAGDDPQRFSCWSPTGEYLHYFPSKFGKIYFEGE